MKKILYIILCTIPLIAAVHLEDIEIKGYINSPVLKFDTQDMVVNVNNIESKAIKFKYCSKAGGSNLICLADNKQTYYLWLKDNVIKDKTAWLVKNPYFTARAFTLQIFNKGA